MYAFTGLNNVKDTLKNILLTIFINNDDYIASHLSLPPDYQYLIISIATNLFS